MPQVPCARQRGYRPWTACTSHEYRTCRWRSGARSAYIAHGHDRLPSTLPPAGSFWFTTGDPGPRRGPALRPTPRRRRGRRRRVHRAVVRDRAARRGSVRCGSRSSRRSGSGYGASGRNGGFCAASLTHGLSNGLLHFPDEIDVLEAEGLRNLRRAGRVRPRRGDRLRARGDRHARRRHGAAPGRRPARRTSSWRRATGSRCGSSSGTRSRPRSPRRGSSPAVRSGAGTDA